MVINIINITKKIYRVNPNVITLAEIKWNTKIYDATVTYTNKLLNNDGILERV